MIGFPWFTVARYLVVAGLGAALALWGYGLPRISQLEMAQAASEKRAAEEKAVFLEGVKNEQGRLQGLVDAATARADAERVELGRVNASLGVSDIRLRNAISALQTHYRGLPEAPGCPASDAAAQTLGVLAENLAGFGRECAAEADRLGVEVTRLSP